MTTRSGSLRRAPFLPAGVSGTIRRFAIEAAAVGVAVIALLGLAALVSYDSADRSWNTASDGATANWLGRGGAWAADIGLQTFGLAAAACALVALVWGWRLWRDHRLARVRVRVAALAAFLLALPSALALALPLARWPVESGAGGVIGRVFGALLADLGQLAGLSDRAVAVPVALVALAALACALGLSHEEWRRVGAAAGTPARWASAWLRRRRAAASQSVAAPRATPRLEPWATTETPARNPAKIVASRATDRDRRRDSKPPDKSDADPGNPDAGFQFPPIDLLAEAPEAAGGALGEEALNENARALEGVLQDFGVRGDVARVNHGPVVTRYELEPAPGTRAARVVALADDIARSMSAVSARVAVIPGRNAIGIELPNERREIVYLRDLLASPEYEHAHTALPLVLGKDISGAPVVVDLDRMPHLLVAGTTGSGKSVAVNSMILSLVYRLRPEECRMIMIDPKMLELSVYDDIPHLLHPVVTEPGKAVVALKWAVREMNARYRLMSQLNVRNIAGYNKRVRDALAKGETLERTVQTGFDPESGRPIYESQPLDMTPLPFIVVVVDEMADLMLVAGKDIEVTIQSLAQKARAAGIHLIIATQRPSVDVITGTIKANLPTRISFQVTSKIDSRTILGEQGAEQLLGMGDMLYMAGGGKVARVHGPFVADEEVDEVAAFLRQQGTPDYLDSITEDTNEEPLPGFGDGKRDTGDDLFDRAVALVARERKVSTSFIQRHLSIGYNRAAKIVERMETEGMVGKANHVGKREILLPDTGEDA